MINETEDKIEITEDVCIGAMSGHITIQLVGEDGKVKYQGEQFKNLLTDYCFDYMCGTAVNGRALQTVTAYCGVGTSSAAPQFTDVALGAQVGARTPNVTASVGPTNLGSPTYRNSYIRTFGFTQGAVSGNITEVGFFSAATGNTCGSRSLIKDGSGNPTSLTVLSTDTLYVTYEVRYTPNLVDTTGTHVIGGVSYAYTQRTKGVGSIYDFLINSNPFGSAAARETQTLPAFGSDPVGTPAVSSSEAPAAYTAGTKYRDLTFTWLPATANFGTGIGLVAWGGANYQNTYAGFFTSYTPKIPKTSTQTLTLTYRFTLARA